MKDVSFEIKRGEVVGIIGRNGAGKSTLLKILSRITKPTAGRAEIHGRVGSLLEVGTGFHPELTGRENIYLNGAILGMRKTEIDRKFDEIVGFAEVEKFIDTPVKHYSSGMYVRLAFAVAAHWGLMGTRFEGITLGYLAGLVAMVTHSLGANTFIIVRIMEPFWFMTGIIILLPQLLEKEGAEQAPGRPDGRPALVV